LVRNDHLDAAFLQTLAYRIGVISAVGNQPFLVLPRSACRTRTGTAAPLFSPTRNCIPENIRPISAGRRRRVHRTEFAISTARCPVLHTALATASSSQVKGAHQGKTAAPHRLAESA
jgi:hypothetical protein